MSRSRKKNPYRKSRRFDLSCRCHGGCPYCYQNRMHSTEKRKLAALRPFQTTGLETQEGRDAGGVDGDRVDGD
jgi:DNA repair photolyase